MKHSMRQSIAALLLAGAGLTGHAQTSTAPSPAASPAYARMVHHDPARMQQFMQERRAQRLARLKDTLRITPAQEGAWAAWMASRQPPANWKRPDRAELDRLATPERIDRMRALRAERSAMRHAREDATKAFYAALDPVQKRVFDLETARRGHGAHVGHHGSPGHHGWGR